jgi:hypothetical protein
VHALHCYYLLNVMVSQLVNGHLNVLKMLLVQILHLKFFVKQLNCKMEILVGGLLVHAKIEFVLKLQLHMIQIVYVIHF